MSNNSVCIHATITGLVQGVFYRAATRDKARSLNLTGWVKNNNDGVVELEACGTKENIDALISFLWQGPPAARVETVNWSFVSAKKYAEFKIIYDK